MADRGTIFGVLLSETMDLKGFYGLDFGDRAPEVRLLNPDEVDDPAAIRFAVCWLPGSDAFAAYPNLEMAMSIGAGVDAMLGHPGLGEDVAICRVRDPHQADLMAGYALHEILHVERGFARMDRNRAEAKWVPLPMRPPEQCRIAVLGHGTMGRAVAKALAAAGFSVSVACRSEPAEPLPGVRYFAGADAVLQAAEGANFVVNILPLTPQTENVLNAALFDRLAEGAWLVQIGRGEHLDEADFQAALEAGRLAGASLDVFREEPLPPDHPFWRDPRIRITPHIASDSTPSVVTEQVLTSARELLEGRPLTLSVDRSQGY
ncbi:NAD(P)-dependent oxidoreductase [Jiella marina]|uniref:NAD(P)-dependent oxidoreductase n=1 Tax=Jiella sp. LLJ827 TaxID=2917712 RepID=UPI0021015A1C|nr:NAD(P)-dependent oxidoreductase [Jiella sp. LLJ827]MCQ0987061.1 NAD(P)-binding domain-containing protein [Jiella sp. LLJ827]